MRAGRWSWHESVGWDQPRLSQIAWLSELIREYLVKVTPRKSLDSQRRDHVVFGHLPTAWDNLSLGELTHKMIDDYMSDPTSRQSALPPCRKSWAFSNRRIGMRFDGNG